jgi:hypothetical protein
MTYGPIKICIETLHDNKNEREEINTIQFIEIRLQQDPE